MDRPRRREILAQTAPCVHLELRAARVSLRPSADHQARIKYQLELASAAGAYRAPKLSLVLRRVMTESSPGRMATM